MSTPSPGSERRGVLELDVIRTVAALIVMAGHVRALFFASWPAVVQHSTLTTAAYFVTGFGHQAVMVFFVLSGYLVGGSVLRNVRCGTWSTREYLSRRMARLYVVYIPALLIGALVDSAGASFLGHSGVYRGLPADAAILPDGIIGHMGLKVWLGNVAFLQTIAVPTFGSNGALWSLANEWWYYLLFPLLVVPGPRREIRWAGVAFVAWWLRGALILYFIVWLLGVLIALAPRWEWGSLGRWCVATSAAATATAAVLVVARLALMPQVLSDLLLALLFAVLLYLLLQRFRESTTVHHTSRSAAYWAAAAGCSYTLYATHMPVLVLIHAVLAGRGMAAWQPSLGTGLAGVGLGTAVAGGAWLLSRVTEARTESFRTRCVLPALQWPRLPERAW